MGPIELTVTSCIHMIRGMSPDFSNPNLASGVIVQYKDRYFICTVEHFSRAQGYAVGIVTGRVKNKCTEIYELGEFSYITAIQFEDEIDQEDLVYCIENPDKSGTFLDIAFKEITLLENIMQRELTFNFEGIGNITVHSGGKSFLIVDQDFVVDPDEEYSFFGRIRPKLENGILNFEEVLYTGLTLKNTTEHFYEFDLGSPVNDFDRFRGCSGAPILDSEGRLTALVTHGLEDPSERSIFGFRFDQVKKWIELTYFQDQTKE